VTEHEKQQLLELASRIEFFQSTMDHDILIGRIERELAKLTPFKCACDRDLDWWYDFSKFPTGAYTYEPDKLQALYGQLIRVTKD